MSQSELTSFYNDLNNKMINNKPVSPLMNVKMGPGGLSKSPEALAWRNKAVHCAEHLKDKCKKHILLDIYCKILPLDDDFKCKNHAMLSDDIDSMLDKNGMTPTQYFTSAFESTHAPLLEFIINSTDGIGKEFMEEADEILQDAQENEANIPEPEEPELDDEKIDASLVDIKSDMEYEGFIDKLKQQTVNRIVNDISDIINDRKEENDMIFNPKGSAVTESAVGVVLDYIHKKNWNESAEQFSEENIGMAIREATLFEMNKIFRQPRTSFNEYANRINLGNGYIVHK